MQHTSYHSLLRISSLTLAMVLVFQSGVVSPLTRQLANSTTEYLVAAVGATARVDPTVVNTLTAQVTELEQQLAAREGSNVERTIDAQVSGGANTDGDRTTFILSIILFILLTLIIINYVLDFLRSRPVRTRRTHENMA